MDWARFSNPLHSNPRVKRWVTELLSQRAALSRALGVPLGELLGCGHWGCVVDSTPPWVVKFTIDPNEGPIWSKIQQLLDEEDYGQGGLVRVDRIARIEPGIMYGGRRKKVVAVVREAVEPAFTLTRGSSNIILTPATKAMIGLPPGQPARMSRMYFGGDPATRDVRTVVVVPDTTSETGEVAVHTPRADEFAENVRELQSYRSAAGDWHAVVGGLGDASLRQQLKITVNRFHGPMGGPLGESLSMLLSNNVVLRDVHLFNIGWRLYEHIPGHGDEPRTLVVFDPGHTPTRGAPALETLRIANPGGIWYT